MASSFAAQNGNAVLDEDSIADALHADRGIRERIARDYALPAAEAAGSPLEFVNAIINSFDQAPVDDPLRPLSNNEVFKAATLALGSNSRSWATFLQSRDKLAEALGGYDPVQARFVDTEVVAALLPGTTSRGDAKAIRQWADLLAECEERGENYYDQVIALANTFAERAAGKGVELPAERLMLCVVGHLIDQPPTRWDGPRVGKLPGMRFALGSEFFRNLGWNGFKPDRHVIRLLNGWVGELVNQQTGTADALVRLAGRNSRGLGEIMRYSLAGIAISPSRNYSRTDNLIWLLGAYVETKRNTDRNGFSRRYLAD